MACTSAHRVALDSMPCFGPLNATVRNGLTSEAVSRLGGSGGNEVVRTHLGHHGDVIVKLVRKANAAAAEASILHRLAHPNIVTLLGVYVAPQPGALQEEALADDATITALVLEFVPGGNLYRCLRDRPDVLTVNRILRWGAELFSALALLDDHHIIHFDIKPQNLLLTASLSIKVCDFGQAVMYDPATPVKGHLGLGTLPYTAPEVLRSGDCTTAVDVYSAGVTLCALLAGKVPAENDSPSMSIVQILGGTLVQVPVISSHGERVPLPLCDALSRCIRRTSIERPSARELVRLFEEHS